MLGPLNSSEVNDDGSYLKLGALWIPRISGLDVSAELEQETGLMLSASLLIANSIAAIQVFAAGKVHDTWSETRYEIAARLEETKVQPKIINGNFGPEIHAVMPTYDNQGNAVIQAVRFLGINGDRWFMRIVVNGEAATETSAINEVDEVIGLLVVDRGDFAMAPGTRLPLEYPNQTEPNKTTTDDR